MKTIQSPPPFTKLKSHRYEDIRAFITESVSSLIKQPFSGDRVPVEDLATRLSPMIATYLEDHPGTDHQLGPVNGGIMTSSFLLKDKGRYPSHQAVANFSNGVRRGSLSIHGKWRKAKPMLRLWLAHQRSMFVVETSIQPRLPTTAIHLTIDVPSARPVATNNREDGQ